MYPILLTIHIIVAVVLVLVVLIQSGRSGGLSGIMGGGGGDALFSTSGQQAGLRKLTVIIAGIFMATSLGLTLLSSRQRGQTVLQKQFPALPPVSVPHSPNPSGPGDPTLPPDGILDTTTIPPPAKKPAEAGTKK